MRRRPAAPEDLDALVALYAAYDQLEFGEVDMSTPDVAEVLGVATSEAVVVEADGRLIGFAKLAANGEVESLTDPEHASALDLHRDLLRWLVDRARGRGIGRLEHWAGPKPDGAAVLLTEAGFAHARTIWKMRRPLTGELPEPAWPDGVRVVEFDRDRDAHGVWDLVQRGFAGRFGSHPRPFEEWAGFALGQGKDVICAVQGDALVGVATTATRFDDGHVGQLAVDPAHRGRGVALALLHEAFRRDAAAGRPATTLGVDGENETARRLYDKAGMHVDGEYRRWERPV